MSEHDVAPVYTGALMQEAERIVGELKKASPWFIDWQAYPCYHDPRAPTSLYGVVFQSAIVINGKTMRYKMEVPAYTLEYSSTPLHRIILDQLSHHVMELVRGNQPQESH